MSNYTKQISWSGKDALSDSDPEKVISGGDFDTEFSAVQTAINSKIDGGTITNFTSTGIDDNATSTRLTVADTGITSLGGQHGLGNNLEATNAVGGAFSISDPDAYSILDYLRIGSDTSTTPGVSELQISSYGSSVNTGGGSVRFYNTRYADDVALVKGTRKSAGTGKLDFYVESSGLQKQLTIDSDGLKFNGDTAAANALDDYEEGTWTPTLTAGASDGTYQFQEGYYTKIGNKVHIQGRVGITSLGTMSGSVILGGFPFATGANAQRASLCCGHANGLAITVGGTLGGYTSVSSSTANIITWDVATGTSSLNTGELTANGNFMFSLDYVIV